MARKPLTIYLEPETEGALRYWAYLYGMKMSDIVDQAVRQYVGQEIIDKQRARLGAMESHLD